MSLFGRALAGAGAAAADIGNKYIDASIAEQKARVFAEIQQGAYERRDQYDNSAARQGMLAGNARTAALVSNQTAGDIAVANANRPDLVGAQRTAALNAGATADAVALQRASNAPLIDATVAADNRTIMGTADARAAAKASETRAVEEAKMRELNPGQELTRGDGKVVARNDGLTGPEASLMAYREGHRNSKGEARDRLIEIAMASASQNVRDAQKRLDEGVKDGSFLPAAPDDKNHWFKADQPGAKDPRYLAYQRQLMELNQYKALQAQILKDRNIGGGGGGGGGGDGGGSGDPLGLRSSGASTSRSGMQVPAATQTARDVDAGVQMVQSDYGGDVARARAELTKMDQEIAKAPRSAQANEAVAMLRQERDRLAAGIEAISSGKRSAQGVAASGADGPVKVAEASTPAKTVERKPLAAVAADRAAPAGDAAPYLKPGGDAVINRMQQEGIARIEALTSIVTEAQDKLRAASKSGDPAALSRYAQALQAARDNREKQVRELFGNNADDYLRRLPA